MLIPLVAALTAANGAPSLTDATAGQPIKYSQLHPAAVDQCTVLVHTTAGTTPTATVALWGYDPEAARWYRLGVLNSGSAIAATSTNAINYAELVIGLRRFNRLYAELTAVSGAATAVTVQVNTVAAGAVA